MESYSGDWSLSQSRVPAQVMKDKCFPQESPLAGYSYLPPSTGGQRPNR